MRLDITYKTTSIKITQVTSFLVAPKGSQLQLRPFLLPQQSTNNSKNLQLKDST